MRKSNNIKLGSLMDAGLLNSESELVWRRRSKGITVTAKIKADGSIQTADGLIHKSPSGAARHLNSGRPIDGWNVWKVAETDETLAHLRAKLGISGP